MRKIYLKAQLLLTFVVLFFTSIQCSTSVIEKAVIIEKITYNNNVKTIIDNNCVSCHNGLQLIIGLDTYSKLRLATENGNLINLINNASSPMPPSGLMSADLIATIEKWVEDGYLED
jgi:hypothetical protein